MSYICINKNNETMNSEQLKKLLTPEVFDRLVKDMESAASGSINNKSKQLTCGAGQ